MSIVVTLSDAAAAAKLLQSRLTLCSQPIDGSPPGFPIPGILQARTLEWVAISFSNAWKWKVKVKLLSRVRHAAIPRTAANQAPPSMDFPGKSTGVGCHCLLQDVAKNTVFYFRIPRFENDLEYFFSSLNAAKPYLRSLMWKLPINGLKYSMEHYDIKWWKLERWEIRCIQLSI